MTRLSGTYDDLANEYYDDSRHPTSANFRTASDLILQAWLSHGLPEGGLFCDVGAGDSALAAYLAQTGHSLRPLRITDKSPRMLEYSRRWEAFGAELLVAPAERLPFRDGSISLMVASLGDPFNLPEFWHEARRVLADGSMAVFTTPSFEWSSRFRPRNHEPHDAAEFVAEDSAILVPSLVCTEREQHEMIRTADLVVDGVYHVFMNAISGVLSPKIEETLASTDPVVTGYLARVPSRHSER
jgi:ubiquinone/menaquinone biosynthesis C-methylase UbiE